MYMKLYGEIGLLPLSAQLHANSLVTRVIRVSDHNETAKLKSMGAMESISVDRIVKLLTVLELNIRDGSKVVPIGKGNRNVFSNHQIALRSIFKNHFKW